MMNRVHTFDWYNKIVSLTSDWENLIFFSQLAEESDGGHNRFILKKNKIQNERRAVLISQRTMSPNTRNPVQCLLLLAVVALLKINECVDGVLSLYKIPTWTDLNLTESDLIRLNNST